MVINMANLTIKTIKGKKYVYSQETVNGKQVEKYLGRFDKPEVQILINQSEPKITSKITEPKITPKITETGCAVCNGWYRDYEDNIDDLCPRHKAIIFRILGQMPIHEVRRKAQVTNPEIQKILEWILKDSATWMQTW